MKALKCDNLFHIFNIRNDHHRSAHIVCGTVVVMAAAAAAAETASQSRSYVYKKNDNNKTENRLFSLKMCWSLENRLRESV